MPHQTAAATRTRRVRCGLGTFVSVTLDGIPRTEALWKASRAFAAVDDVHRLMSFHEPLSDVSRLNREAALRPVTIDERTACVIRSSLDFSQASQGRFDITVAPLLVAAGRLPRPEAAEPDPEASWRDIEFVAADRIRFHRPLWVDLGGIAKGYAVDRALDALGLEEGMSACINAGGDLKVAGPVATEVLLRAGTSLVEPFGVTLSRGSMASSEGCAPGRSDDAGCGYPVDGLLRNALGPGIFVCVLAESCMVADALTKVVMAGRDTTEALLSSLGATAFLRDPAGRWHEYGYADG